MKRMRWIPLVLTLGVGAFLSGCNSGPIVNPAVTNAAAQAGVTGTTYEKMKYGMALNYNDIMTLVQKEVPTHIIESYLQSTEAVYRFSPAQLNRLRSAGASSHLLAYLQETEGFYAPHRVAASGIPRGEQRAQYTNSPLYQDEQPFAYNAPEVDYWYNSAYEESLYSPFSFDQG
jgi:hypothetical protein